MNHKDKIIFVLVLFFSPILASAASVSINEIMYDPPGTDAGREWIEIYNSGSSPVDLAGWKFFEEGSNHGLASFQGGMTLPASGFAIIVSDPNKFLTDYPNFSGMIVDSSWSSFNNSGESLALKDNAGNVVYTVTYSGSVGAGGDGNSLQYVSGAWVAGAPTPGRENSASQVVQNTGSSNTGTGVSAAQEETKVESVVLKDLTIAVTTDPRAIVGVPFKIKLKITDEKGFGSEVGKFVWNFGDGTKEIYENKTEFHHIYRYPGKYVAYLDYSKKPYTFDKDAMTKIIVEVVEPGIKIKNINTHGAIELENESSSDRDISNWMFSSENQFFIFPPRSIVLAKSSIFVSPESHKILGLSSYSKINLLLPSGEHYAKYPIATVPVAVTTNYVSPSTKKVVSVSEPVNVVSEEVEDVNNKEDTNKDNQLASVVLSSDDDSTGINPKIFIGAFALLVLIIMFAFYKFSKNKSPENEADEYKILS